MRRNLASEGARSQWRSGVTANLVIVGKQGWKVDALIERIGHHPELNQRLFWLNGISDEYLAQVYAHADCLIAASYGEGFGLPLIESAQRSLPIIARDIGVFREVAGDHALYFDESNPLPKAMSHWLNTLQAGELPPQSKDMPWMSWTQSASQLLARATGISP